MGDKRSYKYRHIDNGKEKKRYDSSCRDVDMEKSGEDWVDGVKNEGLLRRLGEERTLLKVITKRKDNI